MAVRLTVERKVTTGFQGDLKRLLRELRSRAVQQSGFISGETVVDMFNPMDFMTISTWASLDAGQCRSVWGKARARGSLIREIAVNLLERFRRCARAVDLPSTPARPRLWTNSD